MLNDLINVQLLRVVNCQRIARGFLARKEVKWMQKKNQQRMEDVKVLGNKIANYSDEFLALLTSQQEHDSERLLEKVSGAKLHYRDNLEY
jgi:hypothetical protein